MAETPTAPPADPCDALGRRWELSQPGWKQHLGRFCENWLFALIIAMGIRHFFLEAYRIPTASMEPMLYGDLAFTKADHVLVDKFLFRFTGPERGDVTVFQYPEPEIEGPGGANDPRLAYDGAGQRRDHPITAPLLNRNFVKRCVALPGDEFFIADGNIHLRQPDGSWQPWQKPADLAERLWHPIYRYDAQPQYERDPDYAPWQGAEGGIVTHENGIMTINLARGGRVAFTQPLRNLYLREGGDVKVAKFGGGLERITTGLLQPLFRTPLGVQGSIWRLDRFDVDRLNTADLDSKAHRKELNTAMREWVTDIRFRFSVLACEGTMHLDHAAGGTWRLELRPDGWRLVDQGGAVLGQGSEPAVGAWSLIQLDGRFSLLRDGKPLAVDLPRAASAHEQFASGGLTWGGTGRVQLAQVTLDRDVHYCTTGFLGDEQSAYAGAFGQQQALESRSDISRPATADDRAQAMGVLMQMRENRLGYIEALVDPELRRKRLASLDAHNAGSTAEREWLLPLGDCPERALRVPEGAYLLLGDNSPFSYDSRNWGWVPATNLRGRVLFSAVLPFTRWQSVR